jgi:hypothetical protein
MKKALAKWEPSTHGDSRIFPPLLACVWNALINGHEAGAFLQAVPPSITLPERGG